uniref:DUF659 domain-containing protein n=1 Tax=Lygus hesperus TaxID=30085 RepID=A0A0A9WTT0_LYGHE
MLHLTCLAHGLHRVAEHRRELMPEMNKLVSSAKEIFVKAQPSQVLVFKEAYPKCALPPEPIITSWGTWIEACLYYAERHSKLEEVTAFFSRGSERIRSIPHKIRR